MVLVESLSDDLHFNINTGLGKIRLHGEWRNIRIANGESEAFSIGSYDHDAYTSNEFKFI